MSDLDREALDAARKAAGSLPNWDDFYLDRAIAAYIEKAGLVSEKQLIETIASWRADFRDSEDQLAEARAEVKQLREAQPRYGEYEQALQLIATGPRADGTYNRSREACEQLAQDALSSGGGSDV